VHTRSTHTADELTLLVRERELEQAVRNLEAATRTVASDQADLWEDNIDYDRDQEL
jgi:hypothetical protein